MQILWATQTDFDKNLGIATWKEMAVSLEKSGQKVNLVLPEFKREKESLLKDVRVTFLPYPRIRFISSLAFQLSLFFYVAFNIFFKKTDVIITDHFCVFTLIPFNLLYKVKLISSRFVLDIRSIPVYAEEGTDISYKIQNIRFYAGMFLAKYLYNGITAITPMYREKISEDFKIKTNLIGIWTSGDSLRSKK